jgi:hypothetical protein
MIEGDGEICQLFLFRNAAASGDILPVAGVADQHEIEGPAATRTNK